MPENLEIVSAAVAQLVEHQLPKLRVASSNLVSRSLIQSQLPSWQLTLFVSGAHRGTYWGALRRRARREPGLLGQLLTVENRRFPGPDRPVCEQ